MKEKKKLYCPVRRLEQPGVDIQIKKGNDNLLNIHTNIKIKDKITPKINEYYDKFINFINKK